MRHQRSRLALFGLATIREGEACAGDLTHYGGDAEEASD
jgi:hypothetical protein